MWLLWLTSFVWIILVLRREFKTHALRKFIQNTRDAVLLVSLSWMPNWKLLDCLCRIRGPVAILKVPFIGKDMISITDLEMAKKIMVSSSWVDRLNDEHYLRASTFDRPIGLIFANGEDWRQSRRFVHATLHGLEFYQQDRMDKLISHEVHQLKEEILNEIGSAGRIAIRPKDMFQFPVLNLASQVLLQQRFDLHDPDVKKLLHYFEVANREFKAGTSIAEIFPWMAKVPGLTHMDSYKRMMNSMYSYIRREVITRRRKEGKYVAEPRDLADYYLLEIDKQAGKYPQYFTEETFLVIMTDLILAAADTSSAVLQYAFLYLTMNPKIQTKVQQEIDEVIGRSRAPIFVDKAKMIYTQAFILETLRMGSVLPATSRCSIEDTDVNDTLITKGSMCAISIYSIHRSGKIWTEPHVFRPERFLDESGTGIINKDKIIPFGYGSRLCLGKSVANMTIFIFLTSLLQNFRLEVPNNHPLPTYKSSSGLTRTPRPFHVNISRRSYV